MPGNLTRLFALTAATFGLTGCVAEQQTTNPTTTELDCGLLPITVTWSDDDAHVRAGEVQLELTRTVTASGAKYVKPDDDETWLWSRGDSATLQITGRTWPECVRRGQLPASLQARGNEPFWLVSLERDQLTLRTPETPDPEAVPFESSALPGGGHRIAATVDLGTLVLDIHPELCRDTMTGMPYPYRAERVLDQALAQGCAGAPESLLQGAEWTVTALDGEAVPEDAVGTLEFFHDGLVAGRGFCNRYSGQHQLSGEGLSIGPLMSTKMACAEPAMTLENRFLQHLQQVTRFDIGDTGELQLYSGDGTTIQARLNVPAERVPAP